MVFNPLHDTHLPMTSLKSGDGHEVISDVYCLPDRIVNVYLVGAPGSREWVLIDAGMPGSEERIRHAAEERFGADTPPRAIVLTHGHFDHVGAAVELAEHWDVPVYAHARELPYLTGRESYPGPWTDVGGGLISRLARFFPDQPVDLGERVRSLPEDGSIPPLPEWQWVPTPGHTPGHVSLFRPADRALIAGDAFVTVQQESLYKVFTQHRELSGPPRYFTVDWDAARASVGRLAALGPSVAMTGHGMAMAGDELNQRLNDLYLRFDELAVPRH
ncbi:metallo-beta-lactamase superfamily protein [Kushneria sinocarnis]|uniref:Metallo-beta-lactamase superfamily protein n=1 Tax=Kushneria sinocarnis TaxID=595502 RepID=A0A420WTZ8_9GAMM|nr:MBL fold metallo-hydrolase [Kushneria sinocarnis]RKQ96909.1 metallo-beta-lactamase superfamily protein [Kushneria sinocarnis]